MNPPCKEHTKQIDTLEKDSGRCFEYISEAHAKINNNDKEHETFMKEIQKLGQDMFEVKTDLKYTKNEVTEIKESQKQMTDKIDKIVEIGTDITWIKWFFFAVCSVIIAYVIKMFLNIPL